MARTARTALLRFTVGSSKASASTIVRVGAGKIEGPDAQGKVLAKRASRAANQDETDDDYHFVCEDNGYMARGPMT